MARKKQFDEDEILEKATHLFWKKGFHATSIQDLVNELKINRASLYDTFGGKEELFQKALQEYRNKNKAIIRDFFSKQKSVKEGIKMLFLQAIHTKTEEAQKGCFVVNCTTELVPNNQNILEVAIQNREEFEAFFLGLLRKGVETGEISDSKNLEAIASLFYIFYSGIKVIGKTNPNISNLEKSVEEIVSLLD
ncbi:TetR/AcrR family transcriptional regulator [Bernardetia sp.]|uniref:TetR/AcrR family transcriptional regulator n=1 Tax=Bernardetia sp. TaxID=1937974 RepID=UPI0025BEE755|nr:TetR/AcrR family transcriptional regulator [Bernardetia sp.]